MSTTKRILFIAVLLSGCAKPDPAVEEAFFEEHEGEPHAEKYAVTVVVVPGVDGYDGADIKGIEYHAAHDTDDILIQIRHEVRTPSQMPQEYWINDTTPQECSGTITGVQKCLGNGNWHALVLRVIYKPHAAEPLVTEHVSAFKTGGSKYWSLPISGLPNYEQRIFARQQDVRSHVRNYAGNADFKDDTNGVDPGTWSCTGSQVLITGYAKSTWYGTASSNCSPAASNKCKGNTGTPNWSCRQSQVLGTANYLQQVACGDFNTNGINGIAIRMTGTSGTFGDCGKVGPAGAAGCWSTNYVPNGYHLASTVNNQGLLEACACAPTGC